MSADAERDPVEWAQHSALVAISIARTVLDLVEAAVADRERLERLATSGRSFAETWLGDAVRTATAMASGFGFEPAAPTPPPPTSPAPPPAAPEPKARTAAAKRAAPLKKRAPAKKKTPAKKAVPRRAKKAVPRPAKKRA